MLLEAARTVQSVTWATAAGHEEEEWLWQQVMQASRFSCARKQQLTLNIETLPAFCFAL